MALGLFVVNTWIAAIVYIRRVGPREQGLWRTADFGRYRLHSRPAGSVFMFSSQHHANRAFAYLGRVSWPLVHGVKSSYSRIIPSDEAGAVHFVIHLFP